MPEELPPFSDILLLYLRTGCSGSILRDAFLTPPDIMADNIT